MKKITGSTQDESVYPWKDLADWGEISEEIERAQRCILERARTSNSTAEVARDVVEVEVYGPGCTDLTLIDLPGIVRFSGDKESQTLGKDVKELIHEYLPNDRCVILAVVPANVDFHNSEIMADAKKADPTTLRTIPVITKPDLIDKGGENSVLDLLLGHKMECALEFHMVKCRGQKALDEGVSLRVGLKEEAAFFELQEPWCSQVERGYFGVPALRTKLAKLQVRMIRKSIPDILVEIGAKFAAAREQLRQLGDLMTSDLERRQCYLAVTSAVLQCMDGNAMDSDTGLNNEEKSAAAEQHAEFAVFREKVLGTKLANIKEIEVGSNVRVSLPDGSEVAGKLVHKFETDDGKPPTVVVKPDDLTDVRMYSKVTNHTNLTRKFMLGECNTYTGTSDWYVCTKEGESEDEASTVWTGTLANLRTFVHDDVRSSPTWLKERIACNRTDDLPCFLSAVLFNKIVASMVSSDWSPLCKELLQKAENTLGGSVQKAAAKGLPSRYPALRVHLQEQLDLMVAKECDKARTDLDSFLALERHPYTQNHYFFENICKNRNQRLKQQQLRMIESRKADSAGKIFKSDVLASVTAAFEHNECMSCEDHMAQEMEVALEAYGK
eukprot:gene12088-14284_t